MRTKTPSKRPRRPAAPSPAPERPTARAAMLDRLADMELQHGHHGAAERLSWQAAAIREAAR